jgi:hypothetical protein
MGVLVEDLLFLARADGPSDATTRSSAGAVTRYDAIAVIHVGTALTCRR